MYWRGAKRKDWRCKPGCNCCSDRVAFELRQPFYNRQFKTREAASHDLLEQLEAFLENYFSNDKLSSQGVPSVQNLSEKLNVSPAYLSSMLRSLTGQNTQQHIHQKLIENTNERLYTTSLTMSKTAYDLSFEHLQSFSKLFETKTSFSPLKFRQSFNWYALF